MLRGNPDFSWEPWEGKVAFVLRCKWILYLLSAVTHGLSSCYCWIILSLSGAKISCDRDLAMKVNKRHSKFADFYSIKTKFCANAYCNVILAKAFKCKDQKIYLTSAVALSNLSICFSSFAHMSCSTGRK